MVWGWSVDGEEEGEEGKGLLGSQVEKEKKQRRREEVCG